MTFNVGAGFLDLPAAGYQCYIYKVQMQGNKILAAGRFKTYKGQPVEGIVRLDLFGNLDPTFNNSKIIAGADTANRVINDFDTNSQGEILMGGLYTSYDGNGVRNFTLTDENGFALSFPDPSFNAIIYGVLNEPKCEVCLSDECTQVYVSPGFVQCQCPPQASTPTCICTEQVEPITVDTLTPVQLSDTDYFEEASWTMTYSPLTQSWVSYYTFYPNYYIDWVRSSSKKNMDL